MDVENFKCPRCGHEYKIISKELVAGACPVCDSKNYRVKLPVGRPSKPSEARPLK